MKKVICYFIIMCFSMACPGMAVLPAAIAAELTSGEEQVMFSKEVLQETPGSRFAKYNRTYFP